ncbi:transglycosylase SLT domain-containing protein [Pseudorhodoferax sp. Leaf267]|uniref:transglycosylase SLT domain-containing protein n=1 Tax=Pseudorhodoferax sp. Leaf267 TaxID=1736316 RepID=UPI0006F82842|nr:transglycosylase SLT domain-containing protein [Pseudorhodoferax sp. Leaf267]KQP22907.1 lytic transglycosylase [Pseudorhodoferax sp. Leaf267]
MNLLKFFCVALVVVITGCANLDKTASAPDTTDPSRTVRVDQPAIGVSPHVAIIPTGPLRPITAAQAQSGAVTLQLPPADLWERIRRGFAMPDLQGDLVRDREQWYATRPDYIQRMTERSSKYLFHIVEELEVRGMPTELALLPYIESAFNPQAVSSAKAAGMWQFMPATGTYFDLRQNIFRDDRRDVLASTKAALDYLQKLYNMFGDWHLALAAYNWGEGSVGRAIARNQKAGLPTGYTDLNMPAETRLYVPKLQAVKNIVATPQQFNAELPLIENHPYFQSVEIVRDIDVALAAQLADITLDDFRALNPSTNKQVILAAGTPQILLPWDNALVFRRNLEAYSQGQYASWGAWTVPTTMTVAAAAQRVGMTETDLRSVNNIPPRMLIKAGSALIVPRSAKMGDVAGHLADNAYLSLAPEAVTRKAVVKAGRKDTVASIARRYRLNADLVADWNDVKASATFRPGEAVTLFLPVRATTRAATRATARASTRAAAPQAKARATAAPAKRAVRRR